MDLSQFSGNMVEPSTGAAEAVPADWYDVLICKTDQVPVKDKPTNSMLYLEMQITTGPYAGRKIFDRLNLYNDNPTTAEIAWRDLSAYYAAMGVVQIAHSNELCNIPFCVKVDYKESPQYGGQNNVKDRKPAGHIQTLGSSAPAAAQAPATPPPMGQPPAYQPPAAAPAQQPPAYQPPAAGQPPAAPPQAPQQAPAYQPPAGQPPAYQAPPQQPPAAPQQTPAGNGAPVPPWSAK